MASGKQVDHKVTWAEAFRDIVISSMSRGQLPLLGILAILILIIKKIPDEKIYGLLTAMIYDRFFSIAGWLVTIVLIMAWFLHSRSVRKAHNKEIDRLAKERTALQRQILGEKVESSKKP